MRIKKIPLIIVLTAIMILISFISLTFGSTIIPLKNIFASLFYPGTEGIYSTIIWQIRLPRIIYAIIIGAGLSVCGCVLQAILRNPLAEPYTLGISGGAALGATLSIVLSFNKFLGVLWLPASAFIGAIISTSSVYLIAGRKNFSSSTLILAGVVMSFLFSSLVSFIYAIILPEQFQSAILWLMGNLSFADSTLIKYLLPSILACIIVVFLMHNELNLITLGEEKAAYLGVDTEKAKKLLFVITSIITCLCVSVTGIIGFVGFIIPHFVRYFLSGPEHSSLIPASALSGAIFLVSCDAVARTIISPIELPVGVITGVLGGVFFLIFFIRYNKA